MSIYKMAKINTTSFRIALYLLFCFSSKIGAERRNGACSAFNPNAPCRNTDFKCLRSDSCIKPEKYCDGINDCADGSDETFCKRSRRRNYDDYTWEKFFTWCKDEKKRIPIVWICNGRVDCPDDYDERNCYSEYTPSASIISARERAIKWLKNQVQESSATDKWGKLVHKAAVALYLGDADFTSTLSTTSKDIAYELSIQLLARFAREKLEVIPSSELATFVNAFLVTCLDPRDFHGINLITELRKRVDSANGTNPYVLLTLCNAGETITDLDHKKLVHSFWNSPRDFWIETQAIVVMTLSCAIAKVDTKSQYERRDDSEMLNQLTMRLKGYQCSNGSVQNLPATAMVLQALIASESKEDLMNFNDVRALDIILSHQQEDGSFGSFMKTYYVLPVLNCKSLVNISSSHCKTVHKNESSAVQDLVNRIGPKIKVRYTLWISEQRDSESTLTLRVPAQTSLYGLMEFAADIDSRYKFEYIFKNGKPYITAVSDIVEDAENGKLWFPYMIENGKPVPVETSPADVVPKDNEHFLMWYRNVTWTGPQL